MPLVSNDEKDALLDGIQKRLLHWESGDINSSSRPDSDETLD